MALPLMPAQPGQGFRAELFDQQALRPVKSPAALSQRRRLVAAIRFIDLNPEN